MRTIIFCSFIALLISSCGGSGKDKVKEDAIVSATTVDPNVAGFAKDSIDILYFTKPFTDSTRYTRYFSIARTKDSSLETALSNILNGPPALMDKPRSCLSEGKIIVPKGGDAYKVLYFSRSEEKQCRYIYEIKDGMFLYYQLPDEMVAALSKLEKVAVKVD